MGEDYILYADPVDTADEIHEWKRTVSVYLEKKQYGEAEKVLLAGLEAKDRTDVPEIYAMLGKLYLSGHLSEGKPDYSRGIRYLEQGLHLNPMLGKHYAGLLGTAYEKTGRYFQAIHWYRLAAEEFGQDQYEEKLHRLYGKSI